MAKGAAGGALAPAAAEGAGFQKAPSCTGTSCGEAFQGRLLGDGTDSGTMLPRGQMIHPWSQQTAPPLPQALCPTLFYTWISPAPGKSRNRPLKPCSPCPLELFSSLSGCCFLGGRAESNGTGSLQISLKNVLGRLAVATVRRLPCPGAWEGQVGL